jgi:hypothetical protein
MGGDEFGVAVDLDRAGGRPQPQGLAHEPERDRVQGAIELHVCVAMHDHAVGASWKLTHLPVEN